MDITLMDNDDSDVEFTYRPTELMFDVMWQNFGAFEAIVCIKTLDETDPYRDNLETSMIEGGLPEYFCRMIDDGYWLVLGRHYEFVKQDMIRRGFTYRKIIH